MTPPSEKGQSKSKDRAARRSKRVNLAIPIVLSGKDSSGNEFQESTRTAVVNRHGARITTTRELVLGGVVTVENRSLALAAKATVVSVGKRRFPGEPVEIGVQLIKAGNVWGIIFPPEDWEPGPPLGDDGEELDGTPKPTAPTAGATSSPAPATGPIQAARSSQSPTPGADILTPPPPEPVPPRAMTTPVRPTPPLVPAAAPDPPREKIDAITTAVLAKLIKHLDEAADTRLKGYTEKVIRFTNQFALRVQANFQDAANRTEDQMVVLIQQKLGALADRVQASRTALESLLARFDALQRNSRTLVEDTEQEIREASQLALESALQELTVNLRQGVEGTSATLEAECQEQVLAAVSKTVNATLAKADEHLAVLMKDRLFKSYAELKRQQEQLTDGIKEQLNQIALSGTTNLAARLETMAGEIVPAVREEMEKSLQESAEKVVARTTQSLQDQTQLLTQDTLVSLQEAVQSLQDRMQEESREVRQSSEQEIIKAAEAFSRNVAQRSELAIGSVQSAAEQGTSKLKAAQLESVRSLRAGVEDYQKQLAARSALALEGFQNDLHNFVRELQEGAARLLSQKLQITADELAEASAEKVRQRVQDEAVAATEIFSKESNKRLSAMAEEFFASSSQELQARLQGQAEAQLDAVIRSAPDKFSEHLEKLTQEAGLTLVKVSGDELQKVARTLLQSSSETLREDVGQLTGKLQNDLKAFQATLADQAKKQLLAMARSTVETLNQEAFAGLEQYRTRLQKVAQESHEESLRELEANFQEALEKQRAAISVLLQQQAEQSRDLAGLQIKTLSEQIVAKATEALDRQVGKSTRTVAELGEQARVGLENQGQKIEMEAKNSIWEYQRQMEQSSNASLDKFRKDTSILLDEVVFRLQQSVRSFQSATADEVLAELQKASENLLEVSAAQMRKQTEQSLDLITERLKEKEEEVVSDAANVFRSRIAEIFAILQEGSKKTSELPDPERVKKQS
jgi:hypothetical protein